jgi:hypothetical protein
MTKKQQIEELAAENDGLLFARDAVKRGVPREYLRLAVEEGILESAGWGAYVTRDTLPDVGFILQQRYRAAVFSHETAAYFLGYTTRDPIVHCVTVPSGYNSTLLKHADVKVYYTKRVEKADLVDSSTMFGRKINCFNIEKTICDLCSPRYDGDKDIALEVIKTYARSKDKDISKLMSYAVTEKTRKTVRGYMEVLL